MCGRYTLVNLAHLTNLFPWITEPPVDVPARYNIAPSQPILAVSNDKPDKYDKSDKSDKRAHDHTGSIGMESADAARSDVARDTLTPDDMQINWQGASPPSP